MGVDTDVAQPRTLGRPGGLEELGAILHQDRDGGPYGRATVAQMARNLIDRESSSPKVTRRPLGSTMIAGCAAPLRRERRRGWFVDRHCGPRRRAP